MKRKDQKKLTLQLLKTASRNMQLFCYKMVQTGLLPLCELVALKRNYFPYLNEENYKIEPIIIDALYVTKKSEVLERLRYCVWDAQHAYPEETKEFLDKISLLVDNLRLGKEWEETFILLALTGRIMPPCYNLYLTREPIKLKPKVIDGKIRYPRAPILCRTMIYLNPDTSTKDIEATLPEIKKMNRQAFPGFKSFNSRKNFYTEMAQQLKAREFKSKISENEKFKGLSDYEIRLHKAGNDLNYINKLRRQKGNYKPARIKTKRTDKEFVKDVLGIRRKLDQAKETNKIRKNRQRTQL